MQPRPLLSTRVKDPRLRNATLIIVSECLLGTNIVDKLAERGVVLYACPERERDTYHGKIATIIRCSQPRAIEVYTAEGSPHCFLLHTAVETAIFITDSQIEVKHYVVLGQEQIVEVRREAIRVARYLHIVDELVRRCPDVLQRLSALSLEHRALARSES